MKLYSENKDYKLYQGNMLDMLDFIEPQTIDSIVCDPPYELNFMNKGWDNSGIAFQSDTWEKCYEVLKPGGYLLAFGGSRTFHRIACAIEDAGFEIRDTIMWLYGSGFPKSHNIGLDIDKLNGCPDRGHRVATASRFHPDGTFEPNGEKLEPYETKTEEAHKWNGWGTALKPSFEPIIVARKPLDGTVARNCLKYGVGGINTDECRVEPTKEILSRKINKANNDVYGNYNNFGNENNISDTLGRFPANTILTYDETDFDEVCGGFPNTKGNNPKVLGKKGFWFEDERDTKQMTSGYNDSGSASRYFMNCKYTGKDEDFRRYIYTPKASKKDRDEGLDSFNEEKVNDGRQKEVDNAFQRGETLRKNTHPTVKPTDLMQYLVRLVSPNGATILDPFNGSGSTGKAVMYENKERNKNYKYIGIELTEEYLPIAKARIEYVSNMKPDDSQMNIFDLLEKEDS